MNGIDMRVFQPFSPETAAISHVFIEVLIVCAVIMAIVIAAVGLGLYRFRGRPGAADPAAHFGNRPLEILWTVGPTLIVIWLFVLTARGMRQSDPVPPANRVPDLILIGHQFWWEARYPKAGVVTANEIHLPMGTTWLVRMQSADVIHDFWVAALARKIQLIPGETNHIWLEAKTPGRYDADCVEFCGAEHSWMRGMVVVESPADFATWLNGEKQSAAEPVTASARNGLKIFTTQTCVNCHSLRGVSSTSGAAPDLTGFGNRQILGAGVLPNTTTNLIRWLINPQAIKPGCLMPDLNLTVTQARDLANYLENLK